MKNEISKQNNLQDDLLLYKTIYSTNNNQSIEEKNKILNGRWNKEEQIRFIKGCLLYGNDWTKLKKYVKTRTSGQIRSHAQKYLIKLNMKYQKINFNDKIFQDFSNNNNIIKNYINNFNFYDMEKIEKIILFIFKKYNCDSFDNKYYINDYEKIDYDDFEICEQLKEKEKIFQILKIPKNKKEYINKEEIKTNLNEKLLNLFLGNKRNISETKINYEEMYNSLNGINNFGIEPNKMIEIEKFINFCLDSNDPLYLLKLFIYFNTNNLILNQQFNLFDLNNFPLSNINNNLLNLKNNNYLNDNYNQCNNDIKTSSSSSIDNDKFNSNFNKYFCGDYKKINNGNEENIFLNNTNSALFNNNYLNRNFNFQYPIQNYFYVNGSQNQ
jgi:SHAQKYF class myb-like DNA-binding protein